MSSTTSRSTSEQGKLSVNGVDLHYQMRGDGSHPIVCIPGALGTAESDFKPQLEYFGREGSGFKIVAFDPRGYGLSRPAERFSEGEDYFFISDAKDAHSLMQALSLPRYSVLGWSDGGIAGLILASLYPESVSTMAVWGANAYVTKEEIEDYEKIRGIETWNPKMKDPLLKTYGPSLQEMWSNWIDCIKRIYLEREGDLCKEDLSKIKCPTLIVHGTKDPLVPGFHPRYLKDHVRGSRLVEMEEGRHNLHLRYHQDFNTTVEGFINSFL